MNSLTPLQLRRAGTEDATRIAAIYNHYVADTVITFELDPVPVEEMAARIDEINAQGLPWLVAESDNAVVGYAYASRWRTRAAYRHSVEASIYLAPDAVGRGIGRALYAGLIAELRGLDVHAVIGGAALPNPASVALHAALGFEQVAHFRETGYKFGQWVDVAYWQLLLRDSA
jgi:L-amino acid N-acyltransferase YncA